MHLWGNIRFPSAFGHTRDRVSWGLSFILKLALARSVRAAWSFSFLLLVLFLVWYFFRLQTFACGRKFSWGRKIWEKENFFSIYKYKTVFVFLSSLESVRLLLKSNFHWGLLENITRFFYTLTPTKFLTWKFYYGSVEPFAEDGNWYYVWDIKFSERRPFSGRTAEEFFLDVCNLFSEFSTVFEQYT